MEVKRFLHKALTLLIVVFATLLPSRADFSFRNMELKFIQISDSHISQREDTPYKSLSKSYDLLGDAIKQTNNIKAIDFVMFTGDMVDQPFKQSYRDFFLLLTKLNYPSLSTFGNHDMLQKPAEGNAAPPYVTKEEALAIIKKCNPYYDFDKSYYAFSPKDNYRVIVLDTTIDDRITANGFVPIEQLEFLDKEIAANQDKVIVIFHHHPLVEPFKSEHHRILNAKDYMAILTKYKKTPILVFSGHYHATKIIRQGNIVHISTPSLVTYPNAFRLVDITDFSDRTIVDFTYMETGLKEVQNKSKLSTIASAALSGLLNDRVQTITIRKNKKYDNTYKEQEPKEIKENKFLQNISEKRTKKVKKKRIKNLENVQDSLETSAQEMQNAVDTKEEKTPD